MKKIVIGLLMILLLVTVTACNKVNKSTDAYRFKEEYESLNGQDNGTGKTYRILEIPLDNPFIYTTSDKIVEMINKNESFVVYFGFAKCPWCRSMIEQLIKSAKDNDIKKIYYVDILEIRDQYKLDEEGELHKTNEGTEGYNKLLDKISNVLSDYTVKDAEGNEVPTGEKRIYAPNVVVVVNGKAEKMVEGTSEKLVDPYSDLTDEMIKESYNSFNCLWDCLENGSNMCQKNTC